MTSGIIKTSIQLGKEKLKRSKIIRALASPYMRLHLKRLDEEYAKSEDAEYLRSLHDSHRNQRCFIIGNGPSLRSSDLDMLKGEFTFAANGIHNAFNETAWRPTYYVCIDYNYIALETEAILSIEAERLFLDLYAKRFIKEQPTNVTFINEHRKAWSFQKYDTSAIGYSHKLDTYVSAGHTVTYAAMQLAVYMGFAEIYLIGVDHTYGRSISSNGEIIETGESKTHFFKDKIQGEYFFEGVEFAYHLANIESQKRGSRIFNATRGGCLQEFKRVDFDSLFD